MNRENSTPKQRIALGAAIAEMYIAAQGVSMTASDHACDALEGADVFVRFGFNGRMERSPYPVRDMAGSGELAIRLRTSSRQPTHFAIWSFEYKGWWNDHTKAWVRGIEDGTIYTQNYEANEECIRILQETGHTHQLRSIPIDPTNYKPLAFGAFA